VDLRTSGDAKINSVISFHPAHTDIIRDIQWNPFVPFWFASAGEDGVVHVWYVVNDPLASFFFLLLLSCS
jgi:WD40 repeat protein